MKRALAACMTLACFSQAAPAAFYSGNDLHALCLKARDNPISNHTVVTYAIGVADRSAFEDMADRLCIPRSVSAQQVGDVVCQYLAADPMQRHFSAASLVEISLRRAWPCPKP